LETLTLQDLRMHHKVLVSDMSLYLRQHETGDVAAQQQQLNKIQAAMTDYMRLIGEVCIYNNALVTSLHLVSDRCS
jgi:hypothetical protein